MSVIITQYCDGDGCDASREIPAISLKNARPPSYKLAEGGWREVREGRHLCPACIRKALG
jgi:hypothetical protein